MFSASFRNTNLNMQISVQISGVQFLCEVNFRVPKVIPNKSDKIIGIG